MSTIELINNAESSTLNQEWPMVTAYRCHVCLIKEDDGRYSAVVLNLPGAGSCGDTEDEAIENAQEAVRGVVESHAEAGEDIPWANSCSEDIPAGATHKWILVNA